MRVVVFCCFLFSRLQLSACFHLNLMPDGVISCVGVSFSSGQADATPRAATLRYLVLDLGAWVRLEHDGEQCEGEWRVDRGKRPALFLLCSGAQPSRIASFANKNILWRYGLTASIQ